MDGLYVYILGDIIYIIAHFHTPFLCLLQGFESRYKQAQIGCSCWCNTDLIPARWVKPRLRRARPVFEIREFTRILIRELWRAHLQRRL